MPLLSERGFTPVPLDYGYFLAFQLGRKGSREKKVNWLRDELTRECERRHCDRPSIIAHSFGSYLVAKALEKYQEIRCDRIILCGAIVDRQFGWNQLAASEQVNAVLNQYSGNDLWARVAPWAVSDGGQSGLHGFSEVGQCLTQQKRLEFHHSDYFYDLNYRNNWIPFLQGKSLPLVASKRNKTRNWRSLLRYAVGLLFLMMLAIYGYRSFNASTASEKKPRTTANPDLSVRGVSSSASNPRTAQSSDGRQSPNINEIQGNVSVQYGNSAAGNTSQRGKESR